MYSAHTTAAAACGNSPVFILKEQPRPDSAKLASTSTEATGVSLTQKNASRPQFFCLWLQRTSPARARGQGRRICSPSQTNTQTSSVWYLHTHSFHPLDQTCAPRRSLSRNRKCRSNLQLNTAAKGVGFVLTSQAAPAVWYCVRLTTARCRGLLHTTRTPSIYNQDMR